MAVGIQSVGSGALPMTTTSTTSQQSQTAGTSLNNQIGSQANQYTAGQQALQNQTLSALSGMISGQSIPSNFGLPQSAYDAYNLNFDRNIAPKIAAANGSGSPAIASQYTQGLVSLAAQGGQNAMSNALNAYNLAGDYAFRPVGQTQQQSSQTNFNQATNTNSRTSETGIDWGGVLGGLQWQIANALPAATFP